MKTCLRRFRFPLFLLVLLMAGIFAAAGGAVDESGILPALELFVLFPAFLLFFLRAVWLLARDVYRVKVQGGPWPEERPSFFRRALTVWRSVPREERGRSLRAWAVGAVMMLLGIVTALKGHEVLGTLLLIAGLYLWQAVSPDTPEWSDNETGRVRMLRCPKELTMEQLYQAFCKTTTVLGTPYLAKVVPNPGDALVFGPNERGDYIYFCKDRRGDRLYLSLSTFPLLIRDRKDAPLREAGPSGGERDIYDQVGELLTGQGPEELQALLDELYRMTEDHLRGGRSSGAGRAR